MIKYVVLLSTLLCMACAKDASSGQAAAPAQIAPTSTEPSPVDSAGNSSLQLSDSVNHVEHHTEQQAKTCYRQGQTGTQNVCSTQYRQECNNQYQCRDHQVCRPYPVCREEQVCNNQPYCHPNTVCRPLPQGGQTCRTEQVCENRPECHMEQRCHDEVTCRSEQQCGYEPVCQNVPYQECHNEPVYGQIPYTCYEQVDVPVKVKDYDTQALVAIHVDGLPAGTSISQIVRISLNGEILFIKPLLPPNRLKIQQQKVSEQMQGGLKIMQFKVLITVL